ncbi:MAG TPA: PD-(D/E)XK nuclease family protein, partial [Thermoanaerobaculia bacterium]
MPLQLSLFDVPPEPPRPPGRLLIAPGARAAEAVLLDHLDSLLAEARRDPALLARPVRVVVPSRSLRLHLAAALVRRRGRSAAGVVLQTLFGLASEIVERAGEPVPGGARLFEVLARRAARAERSLRRGLEDLVDGFATVPGTLRDLVDAGLEPVHAEAAEEALASDGPLAASRAEVERARALVRAAARAEEWMRGLGLGRASTLLRRAAELLETDPGGESVLPGRAVLIHGFADATGVATDLLEALLRRRGAWLILDQPPRPDGDGTEKAFTRRFAERLASAARIETAEVSRDGGPASLQAFEAAGADAEVRELARRARILIDGGARPEGIGVVARDLGPYRLALRRHLGRLGVPFSGVGEHGALDPAGRRARAFLELLREGESVPSDRWLDAVAALPGVRGAGGWVDLRLAFYSLGAGRLRDASEVQVEEVLRNQRNDSFPLPIRQGLRTAAAALDGEEDGGPEDDEAPAGRRNEAHARRRRVAGNLLRAAVRAAQATRDRLAAWPDEATAAEHIARLRSLLVDDLGWDSGAEESRPMFEGLDALEREVPARLRLAPDEMRLLLEGQLEKAGASGLGGGGGGVQVLSVTEARGRTFDHLFVCGLNRDSFPRTVREDPLLPDDLRRILRRVLPDVPIKRSGFDEERYLFAQLLSASPAVTLSWQAADDDGKPLSPSPLVERLRERTGVGRAPALWALPLTGPLPGPRTAFEHAVLAGLHAPRRWFGRVLPLALEEARAELDSPVYELRPDRLAVYRLAVLDELDPDLRTPEGRAARARLGPYFGFIGRLPGSEGEPRLRDLYITQLENLAACPWQLFLVRLLRLEPTPDPLAALPGLDAVLLGNVVHATLDRIARPPGQPEDVRGVRGLTPVPVAWPDEDVLDRVLHEEAERLLALEGVRLAGLARSLAERARPMLDTVREVDWSGGVVPVLATEAEGELDVGDSPGTLRHVLFQADRVDHSRGLVVWTDYKTGKPISRAKRPEVRRRHFLERVKSGANLQAVAYLLGSEGESMGRYLFLRPGLEEDAREFSVISGDQEFAEAFVAASEAVLAAWESGSFFPRLVEPDGRSEPGRCGFCTVAEACLRGDSGARQRLHEWTVEGEEGEDFAETSLLRVWRLMGGGAPPEPSPPGPLSRLPSPSPGEGERRKNVLPFSPSSGEGGRGRERGP